MFTVRYELSPYIKQICFLLKGLIGCISQACTLHITGLITCLKSWSGISYIVCRSIDYVELRGGTSILWYKIYLLDQNVPFCQDWLSGEEKVDRIRYCAVRFRLIQVLKVKTVDPQDRGSFPLKTEFHSIQVPFNAASTLLSNHLFPESYVSLFRNIKWPEMLL